MSFDPNRYYVGVICALSIELAAMRSVLDQQHDSKYRSGDPNAYVLGSIGQHDVVICQLASTGKVNAAIAVNHMMQTYPAIEVTMMVGICGGAPTAKDDIRLGDIIVSKPTEQHGGVVQWDFGRRLSNNTFQRVGTLNKPPARLVALMNRLQSKHLLDGDDVMKHYQTYFIDRRAQTGVFDYPGQEEDILYATAYEHEDGSATCGACDPEQRNGRPVRANTSPLLFYGNLASGDTVLRDANIRDEMAETEGILGFEMESAGLMDSAPCMAIRGVCDYADSHKNKRWQGYAAAVAACYTREFLLDMEAIGDVSGTYGIKAAGATVEGEQRDQMLLEWQGARATFNMQYTVIHDKALHQARQLVRTITGASCWDTAAFVDGHSDLLQQDFKYLPENACEWMLRDAAIATWLKINSLSPHQRYLAICGGRGTGKFLATSYITRHLMNSPHKPLVLNFCKLSWQKQALTPELIVRYVISDLLSQRPDVFHKQILLPSGRRRYLDRFSSVKNNLDMHFDLLVDILTSDSIGLVYLIIDGMDTCKHRAAFAARLVKLSRSTPLRVLVSDQRDMEVDDLYEGVLRLELTTTSINTDITDYVRSQLARREFAGCQIDHERIAGLVITGSVGQLGWARHVMSLIGKALAADDGQVAYNEALKEAENGRSMAIGRVFDGMRSDAAHVRPRQGRLLKMICRALLMVPDPRTLEDIHRHVVDECRRFGAVQRKPAQTYTATEQETSDIVGRLCQTSPPLLTLVKEGVDVGCIDFDTPAVREFFNLEIPLTMPKLPPLWLETDNCYVLSCHRRSSQRSTLKKHECRQHTALVYQDYFADRSH